MILFKRTRGRGVCPECGHSLVYVLSVPGMVIRCICLAFTLYSLYLAAGVGVVVILSIWLAGAILATILMYLTRARPQVPREYHDA